MKTKKIVVSGLVAGLISFIVGSILYMNPFIMGFYDAYGDWPGAKTPETFGGMGSWLLLMGVGMMVLTVFVALLYSYTEKAIKIKPTWKKGAFFGVLLWLAFTLASAYYTWLMSAYPDILLGIELVLGLIGNIVTGIVLALVYERVK